uniref:Nidogen-2-like n=1 Tax=Dermatophagoides pteronyssinus TaxID=6956 RepID=A0A6P6XQQ5_DERPT|nr:nidogen-2-like [Dermatophagoides pteronyssinus]
MDRIKSKWSTSKWSIIKTFIRFLILILISINSCRSITIDELYPFGESVDESLNKEADTFVEINLSIPIAYYQNLFPSIFVNDNGLVSFLKEIPIFYNAQFPLQYPFIAVLYSNVDIRNRGSVYYRETKESSLLDRSTNDVQRYFNDGKNFRTQSLFITTWDNVGRFEKLSDLGNTVQLVIASNGTDSYAFIMYPEDGIQWLTGHDNIEYLQHAMTQVGFMSNEGRYYIMPGSGTEQVKNFPRMSNINRRGIFAYHIGNTGYGNIIQPDHDYENSLELNELETCTNTRFPCIPSAECIEFSTGICCRCRSGYYGNGRSCLPENKNIQINGKISGEINNVKLGDSNMIHFYVETKDGRVYSSVNSILADLGYDLQSLLIALGQIVGWLFAIRMDNTPNGYTLTGGIFNRSVDVVFQQTGHHAIIREQYLGLDVFNVLGVKVDVRGSLPTIPSGTSLHMDNYQLEFTKVSPGVLKSRMTVSFNYGPNTLDMPMTIDQTITFDECVNEPKFNDQQQQQISRLNIIRNHIDYDQENQAARYAFYESRISQLSEQNPCSAIQCGQYSTCIVEGNDYRCICNRGFEQIYQENDSIDNKRPTCVDIDECHTRTRVCDMNAICMNELGSFRCQCLDGYVGDGFQCRPYDFPVENECNNIQCGPNSECLPTKNLGPRCICKDGYYGDGIDCEPLRNDIEDCRSLNICDMNAECKANRLLGRYMCICKAGYRGDGIVCTEESESCEKLNNCGMNAECISDEQSNFNYYCSCNEGYVGDGYTCIAEINSDDCNMLNNCHRNAICTLDLEMKTYQCQCKSGFTGDGYKCVNSSFVSPCVGLEGCSPNADCVYDSTMGTNVCRCRSGFVGNGVQCNPSNVCHPNDNNCDPNAQCLFNDMTMKHECQCKLGFYGDGIRCMMDENVDCSVVNDCDHNATCVIDPLTLRYYCKCNAGFIGDGKQCKKHISCNQLNTCDVKAECIFDTVEQSYRCHCLAGFVGDGYSCRPLRSCRDDRFICDRNAECIYNDHTREFVCHCHLGFIGDGYQCAPVPNIEGDYILFAQGMSVLRMPIEMNEQKPGQPLFIRSDQTIVAIDIDCLTGFIYWSDLVKGNLYKATNNGTSAEIILEGYTNAPEGITIDWVSRNIYWTDSFKRTIEVANLEGTLQKTLIDTDLNNPRGIVAHPGTAKLYWTDWNRQTPKIEYSDLDGKHRNLLINTEIKLPNNLAIDYDRDELCWTDAGLERIECIHLMSLIRRVVYAQASYPFDLTVSHQNIYWTDWKTKTIHEINRNGGIPRTLDIPMGGYGSLYGLVAVPQHCPRISNACAVRNGGCKHLCLPNDHGRSCVCPDNAYHEDDICNEI